VPENLYKVPKSQWKKWSPQARRVFNTVYDSMVLNQWLFKHPKAPDLDNLHWKTTAWNAAWIAAHDGVMKS
jgi:hypothetical protein